MPLSSGDRGQIAETTTLILGPRPTSDCFLRSDHSKSRLQTSSGSCTKRIGTVAPGVNLAEGSEPETSVWLRHPRPLGGGWPLRATEWWDA